MIRADYADRDVVLVCQCGWRAVRLGHPDTMRDVARRAAADHEAAVHPDRRRARDTLTQATTRRAARNVSGMKGPVTIVA